MEDFDYTVKALNNYYKCYNQGHVRETVQADDNPDSHTAMRSLITQSIHCLGLKSARTCKEKLSRPRTIQNMLQWRTGEGRRLLRIATSMEIIPGTAGCQRG